METHVETLIVLLRNYQNPTLAQNLVSTLSSVFDYLASNYNKPIDFLVMLLRKTHWTKETIISMRQCVFISKCHNPEPSITQIQDVLIKMQLLIS